MKELIDKAAVVAKLERLISNGQTKLKESEECKDKDGYVVMVKTMESGLTAFASNPVDACYEMINKLNELKLL